jgi:hypothetical protein
MADHDAFDATELASAYLDGEVTDVERARVEGDRELLAVAERLREVRAALGDVPPAPPARVTAAIAAALSAFDEQHAIDAERDTHVVALAHRRRRRWTQGIAAAAAVAVFVVGGFVIANRAGDDEPTTARQSETDRTEPIARQVGGSLDAATAPAVAAPAAAPTTVAVAAEDATAELEQADAAVSVLSEAAAVRPVISDPTQLAELVGSLGQPPPPLDEVLAACLAGEIDDEPDAAVIADDGALRDVVLASAADGPVAVLVADCSIAMRSPTGPTNADS